MGSHGLTWEHHWVQTGGREGSQGCRDLFSTPVRARVYNDLTYLLPYYHLPPATVPGSAAEGSGGAEETRNYPRKNWNGGGDIELPFLKCVF